MQGLCVFVVLVSMIVAPVSLVVWVVKKLRKKPTKKAKLALLVSVVCFVVFSVAGAMSDTDAVEKEKAEAAMRKEEEQVSETVEEPVGETDVAEDKEPDEDDHEVSSAAQMVLAQIAEDMAKQVVKNPSTVKMNIFSQGFYKDGHTYAVQSDFTCSNLMGVEETKTIKVVAVSNEDESKISPTEVYLDGTLIWVRDE